MRDRALLLVGYSGGLRRSELAALTLEDLAWEKRRRGPDPAALQDRPAGAGKKGRHPQGSAYAPTCPVTALRKWLEDAEITTGALFREVDRHGRLGRAWAA